MRLSTWRYIFKEGLGGLGKNFWMSLATITTVAIALVVLGIFLMMATNIQNIALYLESQVEIAAYLEDDFDRNRKSALISSVYAIDGVADVQYVTKEEGLERLREQFGESSEILEAVEDVNPLTDSLEIWVSDPTLIHEIAASLGEIKGIRKVYYHGEVVEKLVQLTDMIRYFGMILVIMLVLGTLFLITNTVRLTVFARRREISIMQLVGATDGMIRWPFFLEGMLMGFLGSLIAVGVVVQAYLWAFEMISNLLPFVPLVPADPMLVNLSKLLVLSGMVVGAIGSWVSVRKYLRA